jgi:ComF family protein
MYTTGNKGEQYISSISAPFVFNGLTRRAIHQFKYRNLRAIGKTLGHFLGEFYIANPLPANIVTPVPLHPVRLRQRGYNQAEVLANELGKRTGLNVVKGILERRHDTAPQALTTSAASRRKNVQAAFRCPPQTKLKGQHILLIDDVVTSGATLNACAKALLAAGAADVRGLTVAMDID